MLEREGGSHLCEPDHDAHASSFADGAQLQQRGEQEVQPLIGVAHVCSHTPRNHRPWGYAKTQLRSDVEGGLHVPDAVTIRGTMRSRLSSS